MTPERMLTLFGSRTDDFAVQAADGHYERQRRPVTTFDLDRHLRGEMTVGMYVLDALSRGLWTLIDLDWRNPEWLDRLWRSALGLGIPADAMLREDSGGKGYHLWVFMAQPTEATTLRRIAEVVLKASGVPTSDPSQAHPDGRLRELIELYPKTTNLSATAKSMGQLVKLPLGIHRKTGNWALPIEPLPVNPLSASEVATLLSPWETVKLDAPAAPVVNGAHAQASSKPTVVNTGYRPYPCTDRMLAATWGEGSRNKAVFQIAKRLHVAGYSKEQVNDKLQAWNDAGHLQPHYPAREIRSTVLSAAGHTGMDCLDSDIVPFCSSDCPIYRASHPTAVAPPGSNKVGPRLRVTTSEPPTYHLPLAAGTVVLDSASILDWERVRKVATEQLHVFLPRRRPRDWDQELDAMMRDVEKIAAPPEVSLPGVARSLLTSWLRRATDDPDQVERRSVWLDEAEGVYVFRGDSLIRYMLNIERTMDRKLPWQVVKEAGGQQRSRTLPGGDGEIEVWEIPVR